MSGSVLSGSSNSAPLAAAARRCGSSAGRRASERSATRAGPGPVRVPFEHLGQVVNPSRLSLFENLDHLELQNLDAGCQIPVEFDPGHAPFPDPAL